MAQMLRQHRLHICEQEGPSQTRHLVQQFAVLRKQSHLMGGIFVFYLFMHKYKYIYIYI